MKVTWEYLVLLTIILFALYTFNKVEKKESFAGSVCTREMVQIAYKSNLFKPRRPEHTDRSDLNKCSKTAEGEGTDKDKPEIMDCPNKVYTDNEIKSIFKIEGVPENCILELVKTWGW